MLDAPSPALSAIPARTVLTLMVVSAIRPLVVLDSVWPDWDAEGQALLVDPLIELAWYLEHFHFTWNHSRSG
jgi:hypothetical protein